MWSGVAQNDAAPFSCLNFDLTFLASFCRIFALKASLPLVFGYEFRLDYRLTYCCARLLTFISKLVHLLPGFLSLFVRRRFHASKRETVLVDFKYQAPQLIFRNKFAKVGAFFRKLFQSVFELRIIGWYCCNIICFVEVNFGCFLFLFKSRYHNSSFLDLMVDFG